MKKILHILSTNSYSGAENVVCTIIENNKNYDMYYYSPSGPIEKVLKEKNIKYINGNLNPLSIRKITKKYNIDIMHAHDFKASFFAVLSGFKGKIISHLHNNPPFIKKWNIYTLMYALVSKRYYKIALVSKAVLDEAIFKNKINNKCIVIDNVIDKKSVIEQSKEYFDENYDLAFIGRITEQKNPFLFINITKKLVEKDSRIKAVMIGSGNLDDECKKLVNEYKLNNNIDMLGFQSNPFSILKNSKIVIMPSIFEGFGLTAIESMCLNKPVINSGAGGLATIYKENKEFICNSETEYVNLTYKLLNDKDMYGKYQSNSKKIIKKYTDISIWKEKIDSLYCGDDSK